MLYNQCAGEDMSFKCHTILCVLKVWKIAGVCSLIVGLGLAIGLSVGLTKDAEIVYVESKSYFDSSLI